MNKIKLLEQSKEEFSTLTSHGSALRGALERLEMRIKKCFVGEESEYVSKLNEISFSPMIFVSGVPVDKEYYFQLGVESVKGLIDVMIEDIQLEESLQPSSQKTSSNLQQNSQNTVVENTNMAQNNQVFIVHGRDEGKKDTVARFVEKLGLEAVILHELPNEGFTIIEKFEKYADVDFAIILYTPCDVGKYKEDEDEEPRARQNVVFEHGYFIGKLGRKNVLALVENGVTTPSELSGVVYVPIDDKEGWKDKVKKELKECGFNID